MTKHLTNSELREKLFNIYSQNLMFLRQHPNLKIEPDIQDIFVCPLCFRYFFKDETIRKTNPLVSIEHIPPEKMGGHKITLTCAECNSRAGSQLDSHLINKMRTDAFLKGVKGTQVDTKININDIIDINGIALNSDAGNVSIIGIPKKSNPSEIIKLSKIDKSNLQTVSIDFSIGFKQGSLEASLLRIAYLWGFSVFGYGFILNNYLSPIRHKINNPQEESFSHIKIIYNLKIADEFLGINLLSIPENLRSFCIIFDLKEKNQKTRYGVLLPGFTNPGLKIYEIKESISKITLNHIFETKEYLLNEDRSFTPQMIWKNW